MARKSRRNREQDIPSAASPSAQEVFPTAIYARLSVENSGKDDGGASIANQIDVCREYIAECPDLQLVKVFQDNGWTGTVMKRPAFDEMMEEVIAGTIRAIVVRDLSRFGRNYIETGTYLEKIFPRLDTRFISVKEQFDTFKTDGSAESLMIPLQNLINDLYSKDISRKVEAALHAQMEAGTYTWHHLPYGYRWNDDHTNIVPDEETACWVKKIFEWRAEGLSKPQIADRLDEQKAPKYQKNGKATPGPWSVATIFDILKNQAYVGRRVYGMSHSAIYQGEKKRMVPEEEWYVIENAHEALVSTELFETVEKRRKIDSDARKKILQKAGKNHTKPEDLFEGRIFCADCGRRMYYRCTRHKNKWYPSYYCSTNQISRRKKCSHHGIRKKVLDSQILEAIKMQVKTALDYEKLLKQFKGSSVEKGVRDKLNAKILSASLKAGELKKKRQRLYEDYAEGILDSDEYLYAKAAYEEESEEADRVLEILIRKREEYKEAISSENKWIIMMKGVASAKKLSKPVVTAVIERVNVYENEAVEIVMKYQDVFELTEESIREMRGGGKADG